jgi:crotonobetainyl-CoA:carnitine CoA-transferase CaiB-like acyl-CoA transferase
MGDPEWAGDERFASREARQANAPALWELMSEWSRPRSKGDITRRAQEQRIPCFPTNTVADLLGDAHLASRDFFVAIDHPVAGTLRYPGAAYRFSNTELPLGARPAPLLGQHNETILGHQEWPLE